MNRSPHANPLLAGGAAFNLWLLVAVFQSPAGVSAQDALRNSLAAQALAQTNKLDLESMPYTVKSGDFRLLVTPSLTVDWNNNINLVNSNPQQDVVFTPLVQLDASYPITQVNLLRLDVGVGYDEYLEHRNYSNWQVNSGSQLSFDTYIKDFVINVHDRFGYSEDPAAQPTVAGTGSYTIANNVAGVSGAWNPREMNVVVGYDHQTIMSPGAQFQFQNSSSELFDSRVGWRFLPTATAGIEGTYSITAYNEAVLNNNTAYTAGVYGEWRPGSFFSASVRGGYTIYQFDQTSATGESTSFTPTGKPIQTSGLNAWYADVTLTHDVTRALAYGLSVGHEIQAGFLSDAVEDSYVRLSSTWGIIKNLNLGSTFSYEHGQQGVGDVAGNVAENFDWYTGGVALSRQLTPKLSVGLMANVTTRASSSAFFAYTQTLVGLQMAYVFK